MRWSRFCCRSLLLANKNHTALRERKRPVSERICCTADTKKRTMCSDLGQGSRICAFYSFTGILFTLWVGVLLSTQSFFVGGLDDPEAAKTSAFGAMGMFIVTFFASIFGIYYDSGRKAESIEETPEGYGQLNVPGSATDYGAM